MKKLHSLLICLFGLLLLIGLSSCHTDIGLDDRDFVCAEDGDCLEGYSCRDSICVFGEFTAADADLDVDLDADLDARDDVEAGPESCENVQCNADEQCYRGVCYASCSDNDDCADDARCYEGHCAPEQCTDIVCRDGESCYRGVCYSACFEDANCGDENSCVDGACVDPCEEISCDPTHQCYRSICYEACSDQTDCDDESRCDEDACLPSDCGSVECRSDELCYYGVCHPYCDSEADCDEPEAVCDANVCVVPTCNDGVQNADETDVDCGGPDCDPCDVDQGCLEEGDCADTITGSWGECEFPDDICTETGEQSRVMTSFSCGGGNTCESFEETQTQSCTRNTTGDVCDDDDEGEWSECSGFSGTCGQTGTQSRTVTTYSCADGDCTSETDTESRSCTRDTTGVTCDQTVYGDWSACGGFSGTCDENGTRSRSVTTYTCSGGSCSSETTTETESCTRSTTGNTCDDDEVTAWGSCGGFSSTCDQNGTQSRTRTTYTCSGGSCESSNYFESQSCNNDCGPNGVCCINCGGSGFDICGYPQDPSCLAATCPWDCFNPSGCDAVCPC